MKKKDFISKWSEKSKVNKKDLEVIHDDMIEIMTNALVEEGEFDLYGFCKFTVTDMKEKTLVYNMGEHKGETYVCPAKKKVNAKFSSRLKNAVNGK